MSTVHSVVPSAWEDICETIRADSRFSRLLPWLDRMTPLLLSQNRLELHLTSFGAPAYFSEELRSLLAEAASPVLHGTPAVELSVDNTIDLFAPPSPPEMTLDTFSVDASNRLARAAADAVIRNPGTLYNPLFIHAGVGLGKTHLLSAIANGLRVLYPELTLFTIAADHLANTYGSVHSSRLVEMMREKALHADVLLVDDFGLLRNHDALRKEIPRLFHLFYSASKQIVLTSSLPPRDLAPFPERFLSRLRWGLLVDIDPPLLPLRRRIIEEKAKTFRLDLDAPVLDRLAEIPFSNIRDLQGMLNKVFSHALLLDQPITEQIVRETFEGAFPSEPQAISIAQIQQIVGQHFQVDREDLLSPNRSRSVVYPRQIAMYLAQTLTRSSLEEIGQAFGGRDHSTVKHAVEKIKRLLSSDSALHHTLAELRKRIHMAC